MSKGSCDSRLLYENTGLLRSMLLYGSLVVIAVVVVKLFYYKRVVEHSVSILISLLLLFPV